MSQRFLNLIRNGQTAEVAAAAEEDPSLIGCRDAQGVSAFLWSIYSSQPVIRDFLRAHLPSLDIFEACALGDCTRIETLLRTGKWRSAPGANSEEGGWIWTMARSITGWDISHFAMDVFIYCLMGTFFLLGLSHLERWLFWG